ncbi:50S ribosomal protein L23 [bacterium]|nr:50S ribosomal protein L23 [bacterium]
MRDPRDVIIRPLITEKSLRLAKMGKYCFEVAKDANKPEIKSAVERLFRVKVEKVHTINMKGKPRTMFWGKRTTGRTKDWKKAIVTLKEGKIDIFEGL